MRKFLAVFLSVLLGAQICFGIQVGAEDAPEPDVENLNTEDAVSENPNPVSAGQEIEISAPSAILMEASTGTIIYEKDADTARPPASVTKIMTMLLIFDALEQGKIHLEDEVSTSEFAASMGGSQVFLEPGRETDRRYDVKMHFHRKCERRLCGDGGVHKRE